MEEEGGGTGTRGKEPCWKLQQSMEEIWRTELTECQWEQRRDGPKACKGDKTPDIWQRIGCRGQGRKRTLRHFTVYDLGKQIDGRAIFQWGKEYVLEVRSLSGSNI